MQKQLKRLPTVLQFIFQQTSYRYDILLPLLFLFNSIVSSAQESNLFFKKYGVPNGMPEGNIQDILLDDQGFVWFGTQAGLVKYDGYEFQVFKGKLDKSDTSGAYLSGCNGGVIKSRDGKIWIGTEDGVITSYDPVMEKFSNYYPLDKKGGYASILFDDPRGNIWFKAYEPNSDNFHFGCLHPESGKFSFYPDLADGNYSRYGSYSYGEDHAVADYGLWMLDKRKNLCFLDTVTDQFEVILLVGEALTAAGLTDTIHFITRGLGASLLLTGDLGFYVFDMQQRSISKAYLNSEKSKSRLFAEWPVFAIQDYLGNYWVSHWGGILSKVDGASDQVTTYRYGDGMLTYDQGPPEINYFLPMFDDSTGSWFQCVTPNRTRTFFLYYDLATNAFRYYDSKFNNRENPPLPGNVFYPNLKDRTGLWWIGAKPGLFKQAPKNHQMDLFRFDYEDPNSLPDNEITAIFEDSKNRLWIGTAKGAAIYRPEKLNFLRIQHKATDPGTLSNDLITTIHEDSQGGVWIGTDNGLNLWQEKSHRFDRFFVEKDGRNPCQYIYTDPSGRLWVAMNKEGLMELAPGTGKLIKKLSPVWNPRRGTRDLVAAIFQDSRQKLWVGTRWDGLFCLNEEENGFIPYKNVPGDSNSLGSNMIRIITEDKKGRLWVGINIGGLNQFLPDENRFIKMSSEVRIGSIQTYAYDQKGSLWLGTYSGVGLTNFDDATGDFVYYGDEKGLLHNDIVSVGPNLGLATDHSGKFYIPTQRGLSIFDPEAKTFYSYYEKDGFQPYSLGYYEIKRKNGEIWIGGNFGLNRIVPENLFGRDATMGDVVLTKMTINDSSYAQPDGAIFNKAVSYTDAIRLKHWQKDITFEYVYLHYLRSEDNLYSWILENYNDTWSEPSTLRKATLTNLSPGTYIFKVKAANADGVWMNEEDARAIKITIAPPWWRTWLANGIYAVLLLLLGRRVHLAQQAKTIRLEREKTQARELEQARQIEKAYTELEQTHENLKATQAQLIQSEKMASLGELTAGIAHEIQNPLNFVNNFSEVSQELLDELQEEVKEGDLEEVAAITSDLKSNLEKINHHGKRADAIVKSMLQHSRISSGDMEPTDINALCDEYLRLAYHGMRAKDKSFNAGYKLELDENLPLLKVVPQDIGRVLLNLINNAFQAVTDVEKPEVVVSTQKLLDKIEIKVSDNGPGIPDSIKDKIFQPFFTTKPTGQGTGLGLSLSYDIVKAHGGELKVTSITGEGATFTVSLPVW